MQGLTNDVEEGVEVFVVLVTEEDLLDVSLIHWIFVKVIINNFRRHMRRTRSSTKASAQHS